VIPVYLPWPEQYALGGEAEMNDYRYLEERDATSDGIFASHELL
jgi:hypothetical protein